MQELWIFILGKLKVSKMYLRSSIWGKKLWRRNLRFWSEKLLLPSLINGLKRKTINQRQHLPILNLKLFRILMKMMKLKRILIPMVLRKKKKLKILTKKCLTQLIQKFYKILIMDKSISVSKNYLNNIEC